MESYPKMFWLVLLFNIGFAINAYRHGYNPLIIVVCFALAYIVPRYIRSLFGRNQKKEGENRDTHKEIVAALEKWLERLPESDKDKVVIRCACGKHTLTPRQWVQKMKDGDPKTKQFFADTAPSLQKHGKDIIEWIDNMGKLE